MTARNGPAETPDRGGAYPRLTYGQLGQLNRGGHRRPACPGDVLLAEGQRDRDFMVVLSGMVAVVEGYDTPRSRVIEVHGPGRFLDEIGLLTRQRSSVTAVVIERGEILGVPVWVVQEVVRQDPALGALIIGSLLGRRQVADQCRVPDAGAPFEFARVQSGERRRTRKPIRG